MTNCTASPWAVIMDFAYLVDFVDFAELMDFIELADLPQMFKLTGKGELTEKAAGKKVFAPPANPHL